MDQKTIKAHRKLIEAVGAQRLIEFTGMTRQAIEHWQRRGIPRGWYAAISGLPKHERKPAAQPAA